MPLTTEAETEERTPHPQVTVIKGKGRAKPAEDTVTADADAEPAEPTEPKSALEQDEEVRE